MAGSKNQTDSHSLAEKVASAWRSEIRAGGLPPGAQLDFDSYREQFSVSNTPLRDASKLLEVEGLVRVVPRRGVFVSDVDKTTLLEAYAIRIALEPLVVSLATPLIPLARIKKTRQDYRGAASIRRQADRFQRLLEVDHLIHELVLEFCPNKRLTKIMSDNSVYVDWCRDVVARRVEGAMEPTISEHIALCDAIIARDSKSAANRMRDHLIATQSRLLASSAIDPPAKKSLKKVKLT
jgi:DNA-binding GntR family transcriptional regulator